MAVFIGLLIFQGCSKTPSELAGSNSSTDSPLNAQFIDAPVKGISYECEGTCSGETLEEGRFNCVEGEIVHFDIAGLYIGSAICDEKIFVDDLYGFKSDIDITAVGRIIQSLAEHNEDENGEVQSLDISKFNKYISDRSIDLKESDPDSFIINNEIETHIKEMTSGEDAPVIKYRESEEARKHLDESLKKYSSFSDDLKMFMDGVIKEGDSITFSGKLSDSSSKDCPSFTQFKVDINQENEMYRANIVSNAYFNSLKSYDEAKNSCTDLSTKDCYDNSMKGFGFSSDKILTSSKLNILYRFNGEYAATTTVRLKSEVKDGKGLIEGKLSFESIVKDVKSSCEYELTNQPIDFTGSSGGDGGGDENQDATVLPEVGNWYGKIDSCKDPSVLDLVDREISMVIEQLNTAKGIKLLPVELDFNAPEMGDIIVPLSGGYLVNQDYDKGRINIEFNRTLGFYQISAYFYDDNSTDGINTECTGSLSKTINSK